MPKPEIFKKLLYFYLIITVVLLIVPNRGSEVSIDDIHILNLLRLDYLLHVLLFIPLVPLWRKGFTGHSWLIVIPGALIFAAFAEFLHFPLPYRGYNINDLIANMAGAILGVPVAIILDRLTHHF